MTSTDALPHGTWLMEYLMLPTTSSNWLGVAAHQNDHTGVGTVAAWGTNLCAQCFVLVAVDLPVQTHSMLESLKLMWMTAKKIVTMTIMMVIINI